MQVHSQTRSARISHTTRMILFILGADLALVLTFNALGFPTTLEHAAIWLTGAPTGLDSWRPMRLAFDQTLKNVPIYDLFFLDKTKFQYPPTSLLIYALFRSMGIAPTDQLMMGLSRVVIALTALASGALCYMVGKRLYLEGRIGARDPLILAVLAGFSVFLFYPVIHGFSVGQIQPWLGLLFALSVIAWWTDRKFSAGLAVGLMCLVKPQFTLFALWGILRKEWSFVAGWLLSFGAGALLGLFVFGIRADFDYLKVLSYINSHGESFWMNQSINGLMQRILNNGEARVWVPEAFPPFNIVIYVATEISAVVFIGFALLFNARRRERGSILDYSTAALSFTIASPVAWEHHYGILLSIFILLIGRAAEEHGKWRRIVAATVLGVSFFFSANYFPFGHFFGGPENPGRLLDYYLFFSAFAVLAMLYVFRFRDAKSGDVFGVPSRAAS